MNYATMTEQELWQALKDHEDAAAHIRMEIAARQNTRHPMLSKAVKLPDSPSMMSRNFIGYVSEGELRNDGVITIESWQPCACAALSVPHIHLMEHDMKMFMMDYDKFKKVFSRGRSVQHMDKEN